MAVEPNMNGVINVTVIGVLLYIAYLGYVSMAGGPRETYAPYPNAGPFGGVDANGKGAEVDPCGPKNAMWVSSSLLPKKEPAMSDFSQFAPDSLAGMSFLEPQQLIGVDTETTTRRNACLDLRGSIAIPKVPVGPWLNSTIEGNENRGICET